MIYYSASTRFEQRSDKNFGDCVDNSEATAAILARLDEALAEPEDPSPVADAQPNQPLTIPERARELRRSVLDRPNARRINAPYWRKGMTDEEFTLAGQRHRQKAYRERKKADGEPRYVEPTSRILPGKDAIASAKAALEAWLATDTAQVRQVRARMTPAHRINLTMALCLYRECPEITQAAMAERMNVVMDALAKRSPKGAILTREPWTRRRAQNLLNACRAADRLVQHNAG